MSGDSSFTTNGTCQQHYYSSTTNGTCQHYYRYAKDFRMWVCVKCGHWHRDTLASRHP